MSSQYHSGIKSMLKLVLSGGSSISFVVCLQVSTRYGAKTLFMCVIQVRQLGVSNGTVAEDLNQVYGFLAWCVTMT